MEIFKRKGLSKMKRPPRVNCSICGRMFKSRRALDKHLLDKKPCRPIEGYARTMTLQEIQEQYPEQQTTTYYGRTYNFVNIPTGNRHLRAGIPLPRISKYERAAI